jgi:hypothetical protein
MKVGGLADCLVIDQNGPGGRVTAKLGIHVLSFEWEFSGGKTVAVILLRHQPNRPARSLGET